MMWTPWRSTTDPGCVSAQLPPFSAARSTITEPFFMLLHHLLGDEDRRRAVGNERGGDDDVDVPRLRGEERHLGGDERGAHLLGVAAAAFAFLFDRHLEELGAHALDLVADGGARVEGADDRAQAARGADRRQAGDAGADDQHLGRRHAPGGRHLPGEEAAVEARGLDDRAIAGDVGHRRQRVHLLRAA